jgi:hypothetical protein
VMRPDTIRICNGSEVDAGVVDDESGREEAGVEARRSEYDMKERRVFGTVIEVVDGEGR